MQDKDEITVVVPSHVYDEYCRSNDGMGEGDSDENDGNENPATTVVDNGIGYRLFTFDGVVLDPSLVGFMAVVTEVLAESNISVLPYAAYSTDHVLVAETDADRARTVLEGLTGGGLPVPNTTTGDTPKKPVDRP